MSFLDMVPPLKVNGIGELGTPTTEVYAVQLAVDPPFDPVQLQVHGPLPLTPVVAPALQRPVVGAEDNVWPFDDPHAPFTAVVP
ncbi:hypothetical protein NBG4_180020 [Candidatus Sulfobium mesophilum]|uniref:Uncharacterized protein n=1 Tax=Candidatus Sulfobium mesophilum TaxID=2016548 RepID=A0A2U3QFH7_9BACT|nr:hypothetical protein NBG4_180020 [Candidatus Sulfobium mesophilum]